MNWGKGIALVYVSFVIGMLGLVYLSVSQDFDLVATDYYEQEIAYQGRIDQMSNALEDGRKVIISKMEDSYQFNFSEPAADVTIHFFRPSDDTKDLVRVASKIDSAMTVKSDQLVYGKYLVKIEWTVNGKTYYQEQSLVVS